MADRKLSLRKKLAFVLAAFAGFFVFAEGSASGILFAYSMAFDLSQGLSSRQHVMHDSELGWINLPNLRLTDLYGPGDDLNTNSQSQRGTQEYEKAVPAGKRRAICVGDSFTLAVGVDDDEAFCHLLSTLDPTLETINLGEAGYGLGQAMLKYEREGAPYDHDVMLFSLIEDNFNRMRGPRFLAYDKPYVVARAGKLEVLNTPVPEAGALTTWFRKNRGIFDSLRMVQLGRRIVDKLARSQPKPPPADHGPPEEVARLIIRRAVSLARNRGAEPVFVFLKQDVRANPNEDKWRALLESELKAQNAVFLDLMSEFRALPSEDLETLYHPRWKHYTAEANQRVAERILTTLQR